MTVMHAARARVSYADLERWPDDGRRYELYDGEVHVVPSPTVLHQIVVARVHRALDDYTRVHGGLAVLAPLDVVLTLFDAVQPDVVLFTHDRQHLVDLRGVARVAPDLCVEVLSSGTEANDRGRKMRLLARHGVREYWLVDAEAAAIEIYVPAGLRFKLLHCVRAADRVQSPLLPDLTLVPSDLVPHATELR